MGQAHGRHQDEREDERVDAAERVEHPAQRHAQPGHRCDTARRQERERHREDRCGERPEERNRYRLSHALDEDWQLRQRGRPRLRQPVGDLREPLCKASEIDLREVP
jgi:hypothetical protein